MGKEQDITGVPFTVYGSKEKKGVHIDPNAITLEAIEIDGRRVIVNKETQELIGLKEIPCKVKFPHQENFSCIPEWKLAIVENSDGNQEIIISRLPIKSNLDKYSFIFEDNQ